MNGSITMNDHINTEESPSQTVGEEGIKFAKLILNECAKTLGIEEKRLDEYKNTIQLKVQEKPLASLLIAGGVGFLLARWFK